MKSMLLFAALLIVLCVARAAESADPTADVPHLPPISSTAFVCVLENGKNKVVAISISYSNGQVQRWDARHLHGFSLQQLMVYADSAPDARIYFVSCKSLIQAPVT